MCERQSYHARAIVGALGAAASHSVDARVNYPAWLWIPLTVWAAFAQTLRNAAQHHLIPQLGTLGATLVRFLYGLPFAVLWFVIVYSFDGSRFPAIGMSAALWVLFGAVAQIAATALLLAAMAQRNFALGVAYSKAELMLVAVFGFAFLGDPLTITTALAVICATLGVLLFSPVDRTRPFRTLLTGWMARPALLGLASGAGFALSAVGFRGAALAIDAPFLTAAAITLLGAQLVQTTLLGGWLLLRNAAVVARVLKAWRVSLFAGAMGAAASVGWFTAVAIEPAAHVRTLGLVELFFSAIISRRLLSERLTRLEIIGMALLAASLAAITLGR